jgi:hypothetical protein
MANMKKTNICLATRHYDFQSREKGLASLHRRGSNVVGAGDGCPTTLNVGVPAALEARAFLRSKGLDGTPSYRGISHALLFADTNDPRLIEAEIEGLLVSLQSNPDHSDEIIDLLNERLEAYTEAQARKPSSLEGLTQVSPEEAEATEALLKIARSRDAFFAAEMTLRRNVNGAEETLKSAAEQLLSDLDIAMKLSARLRKESNGHAALVRQLVLTTAQTWKLLAENPQFTNESGRYELVALESSPEADRVSLETLATSQGYVPEGATSPELVRVANILSRVRMLGDQGPKFGFLSRESLPSLGWTSGMNAQGRMEYDAPQQLTLSADNALGKAVIKFKKYMRDNGFAKGLGDGVEITPQTAKALLDAWVDWGPVDQFNFSDRQKAQRHMVFGIPYGLGQFVGKPVYDSVTWTADVGSAVVNEVVDQDSALEKIKAARTLYAARNPSFRKFYNEVSKRGVNGILNSMLDRWEKGGIWQTSTAIGGMLPVVLSLGVAASRLPAMAGRVGSIAKLARMGKITALIEGSKLGADLVKLGVKAIFECTIGGATRLVVLTKNGGMLTIRLSKKAAKTGLAVAKSHLLKMLAAQRVHMNNAQASLSSLNEKVVKALEKIPGIKVEMREKRIPNPLGNFVAPNGLVISGDFSVRLPHVMLRNRGQAGQGRRGSRRREGQHDARGAGNIADRGDARVPARDRRVNEPKEVRLKRPWRKKAKREAREAAAALASPVVARVNRRAVALAKHKAMLRAGEETVTYYQVGLATRHRVQVLPHGHLFIKPMGHGRTKKGRRSPLYISRGSPDHAEHFASVKGAGYQIRSFEVPKWFDDLVMSQRVKQEGASKHPSHDRDFWVHEVDPTTPGSSLGLGKAWVDLLNDAAIQASGHIH